MRSGRLCYVLFLVALLSQGLSSLAQTRTQAAEEKTTHVLVFVDGSPTVLPLLDKPHPLYPGLSYKLHRAMMEYQEQKQFLHPENMLYTRSIRDAEGVIIEERLYSFLDQRVATIDRLGVLTLETELPQITGPRFINRAAQVLRPTEETEPAGPSTQPESPSLFDSLSLEAITFFVRALSTFGCASTRRNTI